MRWSRSKVIILLCLSCGLVIPSGPVRAAVDGHWRWIDNSIKVLDTEAQGYDASHSEENGRVHIEESGEYSMSGTLTWGFGPPDDVLPGGADVPFWAAYGYRGRVNSYGFIFYGFAFTPVPESRWWESSSDAATWFDTSQKLGEGRYAFEGTAVPIPAPPRTGEKYMFIGAAAVGMYRLQVYYFRIYEWVEGPAGESPGAKVKAPCEEAMAFYGVNQLTGLYTGAGSQAFTRDELAGQLVSALTRFQAEGHRIDDGTRPLKNSGEDIYGVPVPITDALEMARTFDTTGLPTGQEASLHDRIAAYAALKRRQDPDYRLTPEDVFYLSLGANNGSIRDALCCCHSALDRNNPANEQVVNQYLHPLRDPKGYTDGQWSFVTEKGVQRTINPRTDLAADQQGVWYHFFGLAALQFADAHNIAPFWATQRAVFARLNATKTDRVRRRGLKLTEIGGALADFAIALEDATRVSYGAVPDPDKQCVNYAGVLAGRKLRELYNQLARSSALNAALPDSPQFDHFTPIPDDFHQLLFDFRSPLSLRITGVNGEVFSFDQANKVFDGNTPQVLFLVNPEPDGSWGLTVGPQFKVAKVEFTATGAGPATVARYDPVSREATVRELTVAPGDVLTPEQLAGLPERSAPAPPSPAAAGATGGVPGLANYSVGKVTLMAPADWQYNPETAEDYPNWAYFEGGEIIAGMMLTVEAAPSEAVINGLEFRVSPAGTAILDGLTANVYRGDWQNGTASVTLYSVPLAGGSWCHLSMSVVKGRENDFAPIFAAILGSLKINRS